MISLCRLTIGWLATSVAVEKNLLLNNAEVYIIIFVFTPLNMLHIIIAYHIFHPVEYLLNII